MGSIAMSLDPDTVSSIVLMVTAPSASDELCHLAAGFLIWPHHGLACHFRGLSIWMSCMFNGKCVEFNATALDGGNLGEVLPSSSRLYLRSPPPGTYLPAWAAYLVPTSSPWSAPLYVFGRSPDGQYVLHDLASWRRRSWDSRSWCQELPHVSWLPPTVSALVLSSR